MKKSGCRYCMCPEVEADAFHPGEQLLLIALRRPARCLHCHTRQYVLPFALQRMVRQVSGTAEAAPPYRR